MNTNDQAGRAVYLPDKRNNLCQCGYASLREDHLVPVSRGAPLDETSCRDRSWRHRQARFRALLRLPLIEVERAAIPPASPVGAVAQLGERLNGIQEVRGSIPLGSTK